MQRPTFLEYANYRYLKATAAAAAVLAAVAALPPGGALWGGSSLGYALGIVSTMLVVALMWYGIRKRLFPRFAERRRGDRRKLTKPAADAAAPRERRSSNRRRTRAENTWRHGTTLQGWLSAHVYLGLLLIVVATLHAGFRFGWSVHGFAYLITLVVVASGVYGVVAYFRIPPLITDNLGEGTLDELLAKVDQLDALATKQSLGLPEEVSAIVADARCATRIGGSLIAQLKGKQSGCPTATAVERMHFLGKQFVSGDQPRRLTELYATLVQKQRLVERARREIALNARMQVWLLIHVPLSIALPAAIFAHVTAVFVYW